MRNLFFAAMALALSASSATAADDCALQLAASLPMTLTDGGHVLVPMASGDKPLQMVVDTGAFSSTLTESAAARLGIEPESVDPNLRLELYGGRRMTKFVPLKDFRLGKLRAPKADLIIMPDMQGADGLLGYDFLRHFDLDLDFANGKVNFFLPHRCPDKVVYWTQDEAAVAVVPFTMPKPEVDVHRSSSDPDNHQIVGTDIQLHVTLDGRDMMAILDTGAPFTVLNLDTATEWFDVKADSPGVENVGSNFYHRRFKTMTFGSVTVNNPDIYMQPQSVSHFPNYRALLGTTVLRQLHLLIAYKEHKLYITAASQK